MPSIETACLNQKAVLWAANGFDRDGEPKVDAAEEIDVRWETGQREAIDPQGNVIAVDEVVVVDRAIIVGSVMFKGPEDDLASPPTNLKQVVTYNETPDVKGRKFRRVVGLVRYSNELPELA